MRTTSPGASLQRKSRAVCLDEDDVNLRFVHFRQSVRFAVSQDKIFVRKVLHLSDSEMMRIGGGIGAERLCAAAQRGRGPMCEAFGSGFFRTRQEKWNGKQGEQTKFLDHCAPLEIQGPATYTKIGAPSSKVAPFRGLPRAIRKRFSPPIVQS